MKKSNIIHRRQKHLGGQEPQTSLGFTLIELLVVISVIVVLASLLFPVMTAVQKNKLNSRLRSEMNQMVTAINAYKTKLGYYPPDNTMNAALNQLYYELLGTRRTNEGGATYFYTLDGTAKILDSQVPIVFGNNPNITGFMNCTRGGADDTVRAENFLKGALRVGQYLATNVPPSNIPAVLGTTVVDRPLVIGSINPWRYNSSNPTNNPGSFDLWMDYVVGGKTNRICNWNSQVFSVWY